MLGSIAASEKPELLKSRDGMKRLAWLLGTWKSTQAGGESYEYWKQSGDDNFVGGGFTLAGKDTTFQEKLSMVATDSGLFYVADVAHNAAPVYFKMTSQDSSATVFENPAHDFPTRIIYRQLPADSLHARIEGIRKGKLSGVDFVFKRVK
jgi:hypothetical protein